MDRTPPAPIRSARPDEAHWISALLADAFLISPVGNWLIPDIGERRKVYVDYFRIFVDDGLHQGLVHVTDNLSGAAIWYPRTDEDVEPADYQERLAAACGPWTPRFAQIDETFAKHHIHEPHHYLGFLGVAPERQGAGVGSRLLQQRHADLDREGTPAYLEASNARNHRLYLRHGYTDLPGSPFHLPDDGPPIWAMRRVPSPTSR
ncbi:N-acetyltransferase [Catellatospora sp. TT07R-123]|uniref:GNAT family N-acetyltransferase n=1 Tax=Catellatospora sp. TT07R-123 TaxID=2733863 RepID=UPI001B1C4461|nr:GNAT family N-acetyltransferase [Catellatospora sp. TT07R-123]GHJ45904.1 N-acetyltransferase [Catellatospora sp. TT07R-123]